MTSKTLPRFRWALLSTLACGAAAHGALLAHESVSVLNSGGAGGAGASTTDMVFAQFGSDGWGWAGGAGAVQGTGALTNQGAGVPSPAANEALKFNVGAVVDSLNAAYGAGNYTIANPVLTFTSSYARQNNSRFGTGSGTFDIYWVGKDSWAQTTGTLNDKQLNPIYASSAAALLPWSGSQSFLASETFAIPAGGSGFVNLSYPLPLDDSFTADILGASAIGASPANPAASLYLMGTSDSLGMIIFTGGQGAALPTLSFDVVSVPEPTSAALLLPAAALLKRRRR